MIRRNIAANILGGIWTVLLTLALIPIQTRLLGIEVYGLIAFMATLQSLATILDLGLSTTAIREIAADPSPGHQESEALIRTLHAIAWIVGSGVGVALYLSSGIIVRNWVSLESIPIPTAIAAVELMALIIAVRWPIALFTSVLTGVERMDILNGLKVMFSTLRLGGGILVLLAMPDLLWLLWWQLIVSVLEVAVLVCACRCLMPKIPLRPTIVPGALVRIWKFSLAVNFIVLQSIVLTQADRLMIGKISGINELGYYSVAYNLALGISMIQGFVTVALMPALSSGAREHIASRYEKGTQILLFATTLPGAIFICFGTELLGLLVSPDVAMHSAPVLMWLGAGFLISAVSAMPFTLALATGKTGVLLVINSLAIAFYLPALYFLLCNLGIIGASLAWVALNVVYLIVVPVLVQRKVFNCSAWPWYARAVVPYLAVALICFGGARLVLSACDSASGGAIIFVVTVATALYVAGGFACLNSDIRRSVYTVLNRIRPRGAPEP